MSLFFGVASFWSGAVYLNSSMFEPKPQRTSVISSITAFGSTPEQVLHEGALVVGEGSERHRLLAADHVGEEVDCLRHVGHGDAGVVVAAHAGNGIGGCDAGAAKIVAARTVCEGCLFTFESPPLAGRSLLAASVARWADAIEISCSR